MQSSNYLAAFRAFLWVAWSTLIFVVLVASVPDSPLRPARVQRLSLVAVAPEGWSFFTRDPQEATPVLYRWSGGRWVPATRTNSALRYGLGISRGARLRSMETEVLLRAVPENAWREMSPLPNETDAWKRFPVVPTWNSMMNPTLCGHFLVDSRKPVPWAWSSSAEVRMPARAVRLEVTCPLPADGTATTEAGER